MLELTLQPHRLWTAASVRQLPWNMVLASVALVPDLVTDALGQQQRPIPASAHQAAARLLQSHQSCAQEALAESGEPSQHVADINVAPESLGLH